MGNGTQIFFTSDLHFGHRNILKYAGERIQLIHEWADRNGVEVNDNNIIDCMDRWLIDVWNEQVGKNDTVYILGDFSFRGAEENKKILGKLNGKKHLIIGNHDSNSDHLSGYFVTITQRKEVKYVDESGEVFFFVLDHYPMDDWNKKMHGTIQLHGHEHGSYDYKNYKRYDLRVDVGLDGELANYKLLTPDDILLYFYNKSKSSNLKAYAKRHGDHMSNHKNIITKIQEFLHVK